MNYFEIRKLKKDIKSYERKFKKENEFWFECRKKGLDYARIETEKRLELLAKMLDKKSNRLAKII